MIPLRRLVPGVEPDADETLVFWVASDSGQQPYRVDLTCYHGNGKCDCMDFQMRRVVELSKGQMPALRYECKHIRRAARYLRFEVTQRIVALRRKGSRT